MTGKTRLALGDWITFDDQRHQVVGFTDTGIRLRSQTGRTQLVLVGALLGDPSFQTEPLPTTSRPAPTAVAADREAVLLGLPAAEQARVEEMEAHLSEAETGYRSGDAAGGEPHDGYDPAHTTLSERIEAKASELGLTSRRLWQLRRSWQRDGLIGLADKRKTRPRAPLARVDPRIITAIREQAAADRLDSSATVGNRLQNRPVDPAPLPRRGRPPRRAGRRDPRGIELPRTATGKRMRAALDAAGTAGDAGRLAAEIRAYQAGDGGPHGVRGSVCVVAQSRMVWSLPVEASRTRPSPAGTVANAVTQSVCPVRG
jgi:hypothetical protein